MRNPGLRRLSMKRLAQVPLPAHTIPNLFYLQKKTLSSIFAQKGGLRPGFFTGIPCLYSDRQKNTGQHSMILL